MSRQVFQCDPSAPYHVVSRCINRDWFQQPLQDVWKIMTTNLQFVGFAYNLDFHAFVLMNNHFHLLVTAPEGNLSEAMSYFIGQTARQLTHDAQRINQTFARRFRRCRIGSNQYFLNTYKYIYHNPVRAGIVKRVEEYEFSTLRGTLGLGSWALKTEDLILENSIDNTLEWLNRPVIKNHILDMRKALRRSDFKLPSTCTRRPHKLEADLL